MITPITIVSAISVALIAGLFTPRKLDVVWYSLSAFVGAYSASPSVTISPPAYLRGYDSSSFVGYDLAIVTGMISGLAVSLLFRARYENVLNLWMILVSLLTSGIISLFYFVVYDLWRHI